ncbi:MAG TPA: Crp/Fnr family transcriptional regulator [Patescibacteria group bacterium]
MENLTILEYLNSSSLFCGLNSIQLKNLSNKAKIYTYPPGQILIEEEIISERVILILDGLVKIYKLTKDGKEIFIALEKNGDYLGVMNLEDMSGHATVETLKETKVLVLYKKDVIEILKANPILWKKMYQIVLAKLDEYRELQAVKLGNDFTQRTFLLLKYISKFFPNNTINLSQETLASIIGSPRPRVTQVLQELKSLKKIFLSSKEVKILT